MQGRAVMKRLLKVGNIIDLEAYRQARCARCGSQERDDRQVCEVVDVDPFDDLTIEQINLLTATVLPRSAILLLPTPTA
jgi:hypothetical protein